MDSVFHLAIPCRDVEEARCFYVEKMACKMGRIYDDRVTVIFFGDQIVCHLFPDKIDKDPQIYPRHFGKTFFKKEDFDRVYHSAKENGIPFFKELFVRFEGLREEHETFFLIDPSNNLLEFKWYNDPEMAY